MPSSFSPNTSRVATSQEDVCVRFLEFDRKAKGGAGGLATLAYEAYYPSKALQWNALAVVTHNVTSFNFFTGVSLKLDASRRRFLPIFETMA
jgi:hypothetical protein